MDNNIKVLVQIDARNLITAISSDVFMSDTTDWTPIDEGYGDRYAHAQNCYLEQPLYDSQGCNNYIYENGCVRLLAEEEKNLLFPVAEPEPTTEEKQTDFNIDIDYRVSCLELGI